MSTEPSRLRDNIEKSSMSEELKANSKGWLDIIDHHTQEATRDFIQLYLLFVLGAVILCAINARLAFKVREQLTHE
jgi:hypothetical protein